MTASSPHIGTLGERSLHAALKEWYAEQGDLLEREVDGYVIDIVRGDLLVATLVEVPKKLSEQQERLLREFAETEDNNNVLPHREGFWEKIKSYLG